MQISIDAAGRVVIPKPMRDALGLTPRSRLEIELTDGRLELTAQHEPPSVIEGAHGPAVAASGRSISDDDVRRTLEAARDRR